MPKNPDYTWLDKYIKEQADYWERWGLPADIISQVCDEIDEFGEYALEAEAEEARNAQADVA